MPNYKETLKILLKNLDLKMDSGFILINNTNYYPITFDEYKCIKECVDEIEYEIQEDTYAENLYAEEMYNQSI